MRRRLCLGGVYWDTKSYHSHITRFNPPNPHTYVSCSRSNHLVQLVPHPTLTLTTPPFCHLVTQIFQSLHRRSCPASLEQTPPALRQISDPSYELTQTSPLAISLQLFH